MNESEMKRPNNNLKIARARADLTITKAAELCGVTRQTYWRWETGRGPIPLEQVEVLAKVFGVSPAYIVGWRPTSEEFAELERNAAA